MAISLTCVCGAILEIDDKFRGQRIPCPDCNRQLDTTPPPPPPSATSGWALASFIVSLAGMLTLIGPLVGVACGVVGLRRISRDPTIGGRKFALAGIVLGGFFTLVGLWAYLGSEFLGVDGLLRLFVGAGDLKSVSDHFVGGRRLPGDLVVKLRRPSHAWGVRQDRQTESNEDLTLINLWDDAQIVVFSLRPDDQDRPEDCRREAIDAFLRSDIAKALSRSTEALPFPRAEQIRILNEDNPRQQEFVVAFSWPPIPRVFLFRIFPDRGRMNVAVGGTRASRFDRLEEPIRKALESCRLEDDK